MKCVSSADVAVWLALHPIAVVPRDLARHLTRVHEHAADAHRADGDAPVGLALEVDDAAAAEAEGQDVREAEVGPDACDLGLRCGLAGEAVLDDPDVGGGAAGLSAALILARARRRVLVLDAHRPRNRFPAHMHGLLSRGGYSPPDLVAGGRRAGSSMSMASTPSRSPSMKRMSHSGLRAATSSWARPSTMAGYSAVPPSLASVVSSASTALGLAVTISACPPLKF